MWRSSGLNKKYNERGGGRRREEGGGLTCSGPLTAFTPGVLPLLGERPVPAVPAAAVVPLPAVPPLPLPPVSVKSLAPGRTWPPVPGGGRTGSPL